jgi:zinc protease
MRWPRTKTPRLGLALAMTLNVKFIFRIKHMPKSKSSKNDNGVLRHVLSNGAVLLVKEDPSTAVVSFNIWVDAGSIDEKPAERGMAHLIEHMIFKGTEKRGVGAISREVESVGGYLNASTGYEQTCFYVVLPADRFQEALEIEMDAYLHSTFDAAELKKEKEVVFEEMRMRRDDPWSWSWELLFKNLFRRNPYHWPVIGDMGVLRKVPREKLLTYYKNHYVPSKTVLTVVGNISAPSVCCWVEKHFKWAGNAHAPKRSMQQDGEPPRMRLHVEKGDVQQVYVTLGFPTVALKHRDAAALEILKAVLGNGASSRLNRSLREKNQSADEIGAEHFAGKYGGAFLFQCLTDGKRLQRALGDFMVEVKELLHSEIPAGELAKVKNQILAAKVYEKQNADGQAKTLGFWELQGGYQLEDRFLEDLNRVTSPEIQAAAAKYLQPKRASLVIYHPKNQKVENRASFWQTLLQKSIEGKRGTLAPIKPKKDSLRRFELKNGSVLWLKQRRGLPIVSLGAFLKGGFCEEPAGRQGMTTLMIKSLLKGTTRKNHEQFAAELENLATNLEPMMEKDYWGLVLDTLTPNFRPSLDLMMEALGEPAFLEEEVAKEKKMQLTAIARMKDDPAEYAMLQSDLLTFAGTPYAHMPMGTPETVSGLSREALFNWHRRFTETQNLTWVAVGDLDADDLRERLESRSALSRGLRASPIAKPVLKPLKSGRTELTTDYQQAQLVLGFRAPYLGSGEYCAFRILDMILNGMGGRLFVELREKKSLAYSVFGAYDAGKLAGIYQLYIGCAPSKIEEAKREMLKALDSLCKNPIPQDDIQRAQTYLAGLHLLRLQSNRSQMQSYARHELAGSGAHWIEDFPARLKKVTAAEIRTVARKYFESPNKTWVSMLPKGQREIK